MHFQTCRLHQVVTLAVVLLATVVSAKANDRLALGALSVGRGESIEDFLAVPAVGEGQEVTIPVTLINGKGDGPVLALLAGVHGAEYAPVLALQRTTHLINPGTLNGAVIVVHIANMPAFTGRTVYFGPQDLKNLNRSFPGRPDGSVTERIAATLTQEVIRQSDYLIDIHAGDANEALRPSYSAYYSEAGSKQVIEQSHRIAHAFGLDVIVQFQGPIDTAKKAIYTSAQAVSLGVPAMDVESGELGRTDDEYVQPIVDGVMSVMRELEMMPGESDAVDTPLYISERKRVNSEHAGIWYPNTRIRSGDFVTKGALLGRITDYHGKLLSTVRSEANGILLIRFGTPPVNVGDSLVVIGKVAP